MDFHRRSRFIRPTAFSSSRRLSAAVLAFVFVSTLGVASQTARAQATCPFNVSGGVNPRLMIDGTLLSRYASSIRGNALTAGVMPAVTPTQSSAIESAILDNAYTRLDVDGDGLYTATDALIIARYLAGYTPEKWLTGLTIRNGALRPLYTDIERFIALGCPAPIVSAQNEAARLLTQATFGPTMASINEAQSKTPAQWMTDQFALPLASPSHWQYVMIDKGPKGDSQYINAVMESFWSQAVRGQDQLRQRTVFALSQIFVVSTVNSSVDIQPDAHSSYLDMLSRNAFGNFRTLLEEVTLHPTMGNYLSWFKNEKEEPGGRQPDENYAREVMQLFTIGLWQLNPNGTRKLDVAGKPIPTYGQNDIKGMARVFTGWAWYQDPASADPNADNFYWGDVKWNNLMSPYPDYHSMSEKRIIDGVVIPPNTGPRASLKIALDTLFNHPNVGPFIGSQLIKRFVTSNPSGPYVTRVSAAFADNGSGARGDMKAVLRAVLLDPEARTATSAAAPTFGKLREPMIRYGNFMRAFDVKTQTPIVYRIWNLEDPVSSLAQNPLRAPSVFNWYRPDYAPPGAVLAQGLVSPEFQITHETTVTGYTNFVTSVTEQTESLRSIMAQYGPIDEYLAANVSTELALASNPDALLDRLNLLLLHGKMTPQLRAVVKQGINNIAVDSYRWRDSRVATATALIMVSPQFVVQK